MEQKQISLIILGIVAIIAIVGLVLLFKASAVTGEYMYDARIQTTEIIPPEPGRPYYTAPVYYMEGHAIQDTPEFWQKHEMVR